MLEYGPRCMVRGGGSDGKTLLRVLFCYEVLVKFTGVATARPRTTDHGPRTTELPPTLSILAATPPGSRSAGAGE